MVKISHVKSVALAAALGAIMASGAAQAQIPAKASGSLEQTHGEWRASLLDGATVYNEHGDTIGTINDLLIDQKGEVANVVLSVGGFLGVGTKYVEVPFSKLKFEPSTSNPEAPTHNGTAANDATKSEYSVTLMKSTKDSLKQMPDFDYNK
jgi:sporulation protein YlmC with PRC-barrel domain